ncbi:hypothetical protein BJV82DRAFT_574855 [Fennellomyces sp. T-0311]|nr:hypothetical protein BJV82DRAFT_574855 [Fennellomyces sp. T-0311]
MASERAITWSDIRVALSSPSCMGIRNQPMKLEKFYKAINPGYESCCQFNSDLLKEEFHATSHDAEDLIPCNVYRAKLLHIALCNARHSMCLTLCIKAKSKKVIACHTTSITNDRDLKCFENAKQDISQTFVMVFQVFYMRESRACTICETKLTFMTDSRTQTETWSECILISIRSYPVTSAIANVFLYRKFNAAY